MSERAPEGARIGVVGESSASAIADAVSAAGGDPVEGDAEMVVESGPAAVVALGEGALVDLVLAGVEAPVLPVSVDDTLRPVPESAVERAVTAVLAGEADAVDYPLLVAEGVGDGGAVRALFDFALVTTEPARISEYTVSMSDDRVATVRADGVVVATAAGSTGYARAAGGPVVAPGPAVVAVVPVAPFATDADHWVLPAAGVGLAVERDETPVRLVADGRDAGVVGTGRRLEISTDGALTVAVVDDSAGFFG